VSQERDYKSIVRRWSRLWIKLNELKQPALKSARLLLALHIQEVKEAKRRQAILNADCRKATRELKNRLAEARDVVSRIHCLLKATLGPRNERLLDLGVPIQGSPSRKARTAVGGKAAPPATTPTAES
jgi:hypothetical protein